MKVKLDATYKVFQGNVVKCFMTCTLNNCDNLNYISKFRDVPIKIECTKKGEIIQSFVVSALAKCSPYDDFDEETGKRIAESRATIKALKLVHGLINNSIRKHSKIETELSCDAIKIHHIFSKELNHLDTLLNYE